MLEADYSPPEVQLADFRLEAEPRGTSTKPWLIHCSDENSYFVKGKQAGRTRIADYVVAKVAGLICAPVPPVALIHFTQEVLDEDPVLKMHFSHGRHYGSQFKEGMEDSREIKHCNIPLNRGRFAALSLLFGWTVAADIQFLYHTDSKLVFSADHGWFFPNGQNWDISSLQNEQTPCVNTQIQFTARLSQPEICQVRDSLRSIQDKDIAKIIKELPTDWSIDQPQKESLLEFLSVRREVLICAK